MPPEMQVGEDAIVIRGVALACACLSVAGTPASLAHHGTVKLIDRAREFEDFLFKAEVEFIQ